MSYLNKLLLMGNLTRDPELRVTPKGTPICQFGVATNRKFKDESGAEREEVCFFDVEVWGKRAEVVAKYFNRGMPIFVEGRMKLDQWEDKASGQKRSKLKVVVEDFQFVGSKRDGEGGGGEERREERREERPPANARSGGGSRPPAENIDEDVPF